MVRVYMKDSHGNSVSFDLARDEILVIISREFAEKLKAGNEESVPLDIAELLRRVAEQGVSGNVAAYKVRYDKEQEEYVIEKTDTPPINIPWLVVSENEIRHPQEIESVAVSDNVVELRSGSIKIRVGIGEESKELVDRVGKASVVVGLETDGEKTELVLEPGKTYYIGRIPAENTANPAAVYLYDDEGNVYHLFGENMAVSRNHLRLSVDENGNVFIEDYGREGRGSSNGTFVNGKPLTPGEKHRLSEGDEIILGGNNGLKLKVESIRPVSVNVGGEERFELSTPEEAILASPTAGEPAKEEIRQEANEVAEALVESVAGINENEKILDDVEKAGAEIEREVIESLLPALRDRVAGLAPQESVNWFRFLREVEKAEATNLILPNDRDVESTLKTTHIKDLLKRNIAETIKNAKVYEIGKEIALTEGARLDDKTIDEIADKIASKLVESKEFVTLVKAGISHIRYGLMHYNTGSLYEIMSSYKHAIRLNGYVTSLIIMELSDKLVVNKERLNKLKQDILAKSRGDLDRLVNLVYLPSKRVFLPHAGKREKTVEEEEEELASN